MEDLKKIKTLNDIISYFESVEYNTDNYEIGGGLSEYKFASNRHEDAISDTGKLTKGELNKLLKKVTKKETKVINEVIDDIIYNPEWHHAGKLPKKYGGGMKKTYFYNNNEIIKIAKNFESVYNDIINQKKHENEKEEFLIKNGKYFERVTQLPDFHIVTNKEMKGKFGWFKANENYKLPTFYTGYSLSRSNFEKYLSM